MTPITFALIQFALIQFALIQFALIQFASTNRLDHGLSKQT
jgi:hypothetical protein